MSKGNYNLEYYIKYDFIQKYLSPNLNKFGDIYKARISILESGALEKNIDYTVRSFIVSYIFLEKFPVIKKRIKSLNKNHTIVEEEFSFDYVITDKEEILEVLKNLYFENFNNNCLKKLEYSFDGKNFIIKVNLPIESFSKIQEFIHGTNINFKDISISFSFFLRSYALKKKALNNIFPFWMND